MKSLSLHSLILCLSLWVCVPFCQAQLTGKLYSTSQLNYWQSRYKVSSHRLLKERIFPVLSPLEKSRLSNVTLNIPSNGKTDEEPLVFYRIGDQVTLSAHSLKFFDDIFIAYAWLSVNNKDISAVTDYVTGFRYQSENSHTRGQYSSPHIALGIPDNATRNQGVNNLSIHYFNSFRTFLIAHELGHIYHQHNGYTSVTKAEAREQERQADKFALRIMQRLKYFPIGTFLFFQSCSHWNWDAINSTHPMDTERLLAIARGLEYGINDFAKDPRLGEGQQAQRQVQFFANEIKKIAHILSDKETQTGIQLAGQHRPGRVDKSGHTYRGDYIHFLSHNTEERLPVKVYLNFLGHAVSGSFNFGLGDGKIYGGVRKGNEITFFWKWYNRKGKGRFFLSDGGSRIKGTWGYFRGNQMFLEGGGRWELTQR